MIRFALKNIITMVVVWKMDECSKSKSEDVSLETIAGVERRGA